MNTAEEDQLVLDEYMRDTADKVTDLIMLVAKKSAETGYKPDDDALVLALAETITHMVAQEGGEVDLSPMSEEFAALIAIAGALKARFLRRTLHLASLQSGIAN